jgi:outer membrane protein OmpA-like peptidoglycan-associated protein
MEAEVLTKVLPKKVTFNIFDSENQLIKRPKAILRTLSKELRTNLQYDTTGNIFSYKYRNFAEHRVLVSQPGFVQEEYTFQWTGRTDTIIEYHLTKLEEGMKLQFENILFQTNSANILKGSEEELENLSVFLLSNENLEVEIGGHIYSGKRRNKRKFVKLSKNRAKVVYDYLIEKGVDKKNLKHKGYGNSRMVYRFPKSEKEYRANRRVELTIISVN